MDPMYQPEGTKRAEDQQPERRLQVARKEADPAALVEKLKAEGLDMVKGLTPEQAHRLQSDMTWMAFSTSLLSIAKLIRSDNAAKGFGALPDIDADPDQPSELRTWMEDRLDATAIGLIHGEVSEMMEARRRPTWATDPSEHIPAFTGLVEEGADVIIRTLDLFERLGLTDQLVRAIPAKLVFNRSRPRKHGRKF